jgi:hypothetical protein
MPKNKIRMSKENQNSKYKPAGICEASFFEFCLFRFLRHWNFVF